MATYQAFKYTGSNFGQNYEIKNSVFKIKTAKNYSDLEKALTHNFISKLDVYDDIFAQQFKIFNRGFIKRAFGDGIRFIENYGLLQVRPFKPAQPGSKVCLEIPNNTSERSETIGARTRMYCSSKLPDILDASDLFVDPIELVEFVTNKIGNIRQSISLFLDLTFSYILSIDPWGDDKADHFNSFTISSILGAKWDNTAITVFGDTQAGVGHMLESLKTDLKKEIDKEAKLKNIYEFNVWDWCPKTLNMGNAPAEMKVIDSNKKYKKPTQNIDDNKIKKIYFGRDKTDPHLCAVSVARCLSYHIEMMLNETTAQNDSMFPGNIEDKRHEYGKTDTTPIDRTKKCNEQVGSELRETTPSLYLPIRLKNADELIIIMNTEMYKELKSALLVSSGTETGAYKPYLENFMQWDKHIIKLDTMPYGSFKIGSKNRYNLWDIEDKILPDKLGQADVVVHTGHKAVAFGIRQFRPFKYIRLHNLHVNANTYDFNVGFATAKDFPAN